jgi:hypothetical protein
MTAPVKRTVTMRGGPIDGRQFAVAPGIYFISVPSYLTDWFGMARYRVEVDTAVLVEFDEWEPINHDIERTTPTPRAWHA